MRKISVHDKKIVLILSRAEAEALLKRLYQNTGIKKTKAIFKIEEKILAELGEI